MTFPSFSVKFHPVLIMPADYEVLDLSRPISQNDRSHSLYSVGRYDEKRQGLYTEELFKGERNLHIGIDLGGPVGSPIHAFYDGEVFLFADNQQAGDYGPTLITKHQIDGTSLYALFGHLSRSSLQQKFEGQKIKRGEIIGYLGHPSENGGWPPHVHFQLSYKEPSKADMPGTVCDEQREEALRCYPDPRIVLGPIY